MTSGSSAEAALAARLKARIRDVPDFPEPGVVFRDVAPLLADPGAFREAVAAMSSPFEGSRLDAVAGIESRGFVFGAGVALGLGSGLIPLRKPGKLPAARLSEDYELEYGTASLEVHSDALVPGQRVLIVDDVLATGGTAAAAFRLCRRLGAEVAGFSFLLALPALGGVRRLEELGPPLRTVLDYP